MRKHDVVIIGGGLAGLRAAIELKGKCDAAILCKTYPNNAHSTQAQGGINAALDPKDSVEKHIYDTVYGGDFLSDQDSAEILCKDAPRVIGELLEYGVTFSKAPSGNVAQRAFGAMSFNRTCYAADRTGHALIHSLYRKALELGVHVHDEWQAVAIAQDGGRVSGVVAIDKASGELVPVQAKAVILATGGAGRIYGKTTNPENTGDGIAMAYEAGALIMDMEMIQFHPTTLRGSNKLLSEAARGEGAYLINSKGERFMKRYAPDKMELASRDVVTRAEAMEIKEGRGVLGDSVYIDFRHLDPELIMTRVPDMRKNALDLLGIDLLEEPVPVQPGQHYTMAGIATDNDCRSTVAGLFAAGECACVSVHGANRLGGNSLMETLVFGRRAGLGALSYIEGKAFGTIGKGILEGEEKRKKAWIANTGMKGAAMPRQVRQKMGKAMDDHAGPFRDAASLGEGRAAIARLEKEAVMVSEHSGVFNAELEEAYELSFMLRLAGCIVESAIARTESRGAHWRTDFPQRDDRAWLKHVTCAKGAGGPTLGYRDVRVSRFKPVPRHY